MPAKITFTQKEEAGLQLALEEVNDDKAITAIQSLLVKMVKARNKDAEPKFTGIAVRDLLDIASSTLGTRFKTPPTLTKDWFIKMQRAINSGGITRESAIKAVSNAAATWQGDIWVDTLIYSLPKLAAGVVIGTAKKPIGYTPGKQSGWLSQLGNDED